MTSILMTIALLCGPQNQITVSLGASPQGSGMICQKKLLKCVRDKSRNEYNKCKETSHIYHVDCNNKQTEEQLQSCLLGDK